MTNQAVGMTNNDFSPGGRPKLGLPKTESAAAAVVQQAAQVTQASGRETRADTIRRERRFRADTSEAAGYQLAIPAEHKKPGYVQRWVNDRANGRVQQFTDRDWDVVKNPAIDGSGEGTPVSRVVGTTENGQPLRAYLMEKPDDWHQEDQARKNRPRIETEETMKRGSLPSNRAEPGTEYVPQGHVNRISQSS